ncbi:MAG: acetate kinase [Desulfatitalea sp.]|nr:acetate kinase [Desulfatitalea sp.]NNJ99652.1 acetate kinase [Desulfatitalea sp.]
MYILVINSGSSSIKVKLFDSRTLDVIASGGADRIGEQGSSIDFKGNRGAYRRELRMTNHSQAIKEIIKALMNTETGALHTINDIKAVGHRCVHGGGRFIDSALIDNDVIAKMEECIPLAPLHNPPNLIGIKEARLLLADTPQVAVFDTAFHQTMPKHAFLYAIPYELYKEHHIRRYGFHGTSFRFVLESMGQLLERSIDQARVIIAHLGNGSSITAVNRGKSVDTSMGMTPVEGLMMGTRSGDLDNGILLYLMNKLGMSVNEVDTMLNKKSGFLGVSGRGNDVRDIIEYAGRGDQRCRLALEICAYRIKKYIGAFAAAMGGLDYLVFTAGIGENSFVMRELICQDLDFLGIKLDPVLNRQTQGTGCDISEKNGQTRVIVVPTNEELMIARDTQRLAGLA